MGADRKTPVLSPPPGAWDRHRGLPRNRSEQSPVQHLSGIVAQRVSEASWHRVYPLCKH